MAIVREIRVAKPGVSVSVAIGLLRANYYAYNTRERISRTEAERRLKICGQCQFMAQSVACTKIGTCGSSRRDLFQMHIGRRGGKCPENKWS